MSSSFAYEDPLLRQNLNTTQKTMEIFKDMGRGMLRSGRGFGKVGALFAGIECVIESVREYFTKMPATTEPFFHK
jgi:mitochondrial import inner membrane translocase subunit TIM22